MTYEVLIINEERDGFAAKRGDVVVACPEGHKWGKLECPPRFAIVKVTCTEEAIKELMNGLWRYDFVTERFISKYDPNIVWTFYNPIVIEESELTKEVLADIRVRPEAQRELPLHTVYGITQKLAHINRGSQDAQAIANGDLQVLKEKLTNKKQFSKLMNILNPDEQRVITVLIQKVDVILKKKNGDIKEGSFPKGLKDG